MTPETPRPLLQGARALVTGMANEHSIAYGCAKAFAELGAEVAITYANDKTRGYVEPLARELKAPIFMPLDVSRADQLDTVFEAIARHWGSLDILVHSIAWAPKEDLQGGLLDSSAAGFGLAMDISCHSFVRMARLAAPLEQRRDVVRHELPRGQQGGAQLQPDGTGEGRAGGVLPLSGL